LQFLSTCGFFAYHWLTNSGGGSLGEFLVAYYAKALISWQFYFKFAAASLLVFFLVHLFHFEYTKANKRVRLRSLRRASQESKAEAALGRGLRKRRAAPVESSNREDEGELTGAGEEATRVDLVCEEQKKTD